MKYQAYSLHNYKKITQISGLSREQCENIEVVSRVLPFKTNNYVVNELVDWDNFENDPMYILNFPQREMLIEEHYKVLNNLLIKGENKEEVKKAIHEIRMQLNPHPAGQMEHNIPILDEDKLIGIQHKYKETMLFFPSQGQTCHAYCTFCFRWPQFTGIDDLKFSMKQTDLLLKYLEKNQSITDILITGGDPMTMSASNLEIYIDAILNSKKHNIRSIRIGTKSLSFWPYRYLTDKDSDDILRLFEKVTNSGIHLALMAHFNHPRELSTQAVQKAVSRIRSTGAQIRTQSPILNHINNKSELWSKMWQKQVELGMVPYYMFIARDTGAQHYFGLSLEQAWNIFRKAFNQVSGLARTVRGPSMSAGPGKIQILGISKINDQKVFVLNFLQGRNPEWVGKPFFAEYNKYAKWLDELKPAFNEDEFFYENNFNEIKEAAGEKILKFDRYKTTA